MTFIVDAGGGLAGVGAMCYGGKEELMAALEGKPPPVCHYKPKLNNVAPRDPGWQPNRSNTQQPPLSGPKKNVKPVVQQPRGNMFGRPIGKVLPSS